MRLINPQNYNLNIEICTYHKWARDIIYATGAQFRSIHNQKWEEVEAGEYSQARFFREFVPALLRRAITECSLEQYDAILIDKAQDFEKDWFYPVLKLLNRETDSLLITCDGLQGIYARKRFYWKDVGVQARGRVIRYHKSYRIPKKIGKLAYQFLVF